MLHRCRIVPFILALSVVAWITGNQKASADEYLFHHENVMGTSLELRVHADGPAPSLRAESRVLREIDRLSVIFNGYDARSEFSRWQAAPVGPVAVSRELFEMLDQCDRWRKLTGGAFDPRVDSLSRLWSKSAEQDCPPSAEEITKAKELMSSPAWKLDYERRTAERLGTASLSLNAIAKGFIVGQASEVALDPSDGIHGISLNVGGDLRVCGDLVQGVGIASPFSDSESSDAFTRIEVRDRAIATSGSSQRGFWIRGKWYSHIFDPRSGAPAGHVASATVIAERSADADALATSLNVLDPREGVRLVESLPNVDCLIVATDGAIFRSRGWSRFEKTGAVPAALTLAQASDSQRVETGTPKPEAASTTWGDSFELVVEFEIKQPEMEVAKPEQKGQAGEGPRRGRGGRGGGRYRRPYVAVWVEDKDGFPVRNLILWVSQGGAGPFQWIPDLKRWYASDKARKKVDKKDIVLTIARPTRPPGKYSAVWNGKDDKGKPLPPGEYTIWIDAAREHGTYQSLRKRVSIGDKPFSETLDGGTEINSAAITYRLKKAN